MKKRLLSIVITICMMFAMMVPTNAAGQNHTVTLSSTSSQSQSYSYSSPFSTYYIKLNSVSFVGMPANTFPNNGNITLTIKRGDKSVASRTFSSCYGYTGSYSHGVATTGQYYLASSSNYSSGYTCGATWNASAS